MTGRSLHADFLAAIALDAVYPRYFLKLGFSSGTVYIWNGIGDIVYSGNTYVGLGDALGVADIQESTDLKITDLTINLSAQKSAYKLLALAQVELKNTATIYLALLNSSGTIVNNPETIFVGYMDSLTMQEGADSAVFSLNLISRLAGLRSTKARRYTQEDQKQLYPTDTGFRHMSNVEKYSKWGSSRPTMYNPNGQPELTTW